MTADLRRHFHQAGGQVRHHSSNLLALHNHVPLRFCLPPLTLPKIKIALATQILLTVRAKSRMPETAEISLPTHSTSVHRQSAYSPSAGTCACFQPVSGARAVLPH